MVPTPELRSLDPKTKIKILNPARNDGVLVMIGVKHAARYVRQGRARLVKNGDKVGLMFLDQTDHKRRLDATSAGYDRAGRRTVREILRLPVVGDVVLGLTKATVRSKSGTREQRLFRLAGETAMVRNRRVKTTGDWCRLELPA